MIVKCPNCDSKYKLDPAKLTSPEPKIRCKKCSTVFKAVEEGASKAPAAPAQASAAAPAPAPAPTPAPPAPAAAPAAKAGAPDSGDARGAGTILVAHESKEVTEMVVDLLSDAGYQVIAVHDGVHALMEIEQRRPAVAVLDVALPKMFGFEIVEVMRRDHDLDATKVLLIAALYDKTRYKRAPVSLYGADDYIEKHLIPENIVEKVNGLAGGAPPAGAAAAPASSPAAAPAAPAAPAAATPPTAPAPAAAPAAAAAGGLDESTLSPQEKEDHEKAKRLARIIVSDIALYNPDALIEGLKAGNPLEAVAGDIDEGRKLFNQRVLPAVRDRLNYLDLALEDLFEKKRKELGITL